MTPYVVRSRVSGYVTINASPSSSKEEARKKARDAFLEMDFGPVEDVDFNVSSLGGDNFEEIIIEVYGYITGRYAARSEYDAAERANITLSDMYLDDYFGDARTEFDSIEPDFEGWGGFSYDN